MANIQVRVDDELKNEADQLFKDLGTDTTTAIRIFLKQAVAVNGFPFEIKKPVRNPYEALSEEDFLRKLEHSRRSAEYGQIREAEDIVAEMRAKYEV